MERSSEIFSPGTPTTAQNVVVPSYPGSRTPPPEAADDRMVLLVVGGTDAPSAAATDNVTYSYPHVAIDLLSSSAVPTATRSSVPYNYWTATARIPAYPNPDVVIMAPAPRSSVPYSDVHAAQLGPGASAAGPVVGESYTDMLVAHLGSDMPPAAWNKNNVAHPASATASAAINGVATAYPGPGGLSLNVVTARPDTNAAVGLGYAIDAYHGVVATDLGSEHLHPTGAAAAAAEQGGGCYYYYNNSGMVPHVAVSQYEVVAGAAAGPVRGGGDLGGLGLAATSLATAGLIAGGVDTPMTAIALFGMLVAGVILITVRVFRT